MAGTFVVGGTKSWNRRVYEERLSQQPGNWTFVSNPEELEEVIDKLNPDMVFFLHWSWIVPTSILDRVRCINFHMTDLPYGRGGSPLQNLISRGKRWTTLTAIEMTEELDAGPILLQQAFDLGGSAEDVYIRASELSAELISRILREDPDPMPQRGRVVAFKRRRPEDSLLPDRPRLLRDIHDHIRMLDAEGYPAAFLEHGKLRLEFHRAIYREGRIEADVVITMTRGETI